MNLFFYKTLSSSEIICKRSNLSAILFFSNLLEVRRLKLLFSVVVIKQSEMFFKSFLHSGHVTVSQIKS